MVNKRVCKRRSAFCVLTILPCVLFVPKKELFLNTMKTQLVFVCMNHCYGTFSEFSFINDTLKMAPALRRLLRVLNCGTIPTYYLFNGTIKIYITWGVLIL